MSKEIVLKDSKNYLISVHDSLRKAFINVSQSERAVIDIILQGLEKEVEQLEMLEEMIKVWKSTKNKKRELEIEE